MSFVTKIRSDAKWVDGRVVFLPLPSLPAIGDTIDVSGPYATVTLLEVKEYVYGGGSEGIQAGSPRSVSPGGVVTLVCKFVKNIA